MFSGIERDDPFGGAYGAALGVRAGDFVFTTIAGVVALEDGEPVFAPTFEAQLDTLGDHLLRRLNHFDAGLPESLIPRSGYIQMLRSSPAPCSTPCSFGCFTM